MAEAVRVANDPFALEMIWARLVAIADEAGNALIRTSFSPIVRESKDFSCVLLDANGDSLSQNAVTVPVFCGTLPRTMRHFLKKFPRETWRPGDAVITNDPWLGTGHYPDFTVATPVFYKGRLVAFAGAIAHMPDIGGVLYSADSKELFEEGLAVPISKLYAEERPNELLLDIIRANVRTPDLTLGDLHAELASTHVMARRLVDVMDEYGIEDWADIGAKIHDRSELSMRQAIRALPDGVYRGSVEMDDIEGAAARIEIAIKVDGDNLHCDYAGTTLQVGRGVNVVYNSTFAHTCYNIKCAINPEIPNNQGAFRPIAVSVPEGSILNCTRPAPVNARQLTTHYIHAAVFNALSQAAPDKVIAECGAPSNRTLFAGHRFDGSKYSILLFASGGMGARLDQDGLPCTTFPTNSGASSVEVVESDIPVLVRRKELTVDSGGPGTYRGGLGQTISYEVLADGATDVSILMERTTRPPKGHHGGGTGAKATLKMVNRQLPLSAKGRVSLKKGDVFEFSCPGGGGVGDAKLRDRDAVSDDLRLGFISMDAAVRDYGWDDK
jgi:N-methylhydantoinase B